MAATGFDFRFAGDLHLQNAGPRQVVVAFEPSEFAFRAAMGSSLLPGQVMPRRTIVEFDAAKGTIVTTPIIIYPPKARFLKARFDRIRTVTFEGVEVDLPGSSSDVEASLSVLPDPFYRKAEQGLGLPKVVMPIIKEIERLAGVKHLVISTLRATALQGDTLVLSWEEFVDAATALQRIAGRHQQRSLDERRAHARNSLVSPLDPVAYPEMVPPYTEDTIFEVLNVVRTSKLKLSTADKSALVKEVGKRVTDLARSAPEKLFRLHRDIELVNLDGLIAAFRRLLDKDVKAETRWQKLFDLNPFILSMVFGYPIVTVLREATVGAPQLSGAGAKVADFLVKNPSSSNAALVELKTPQQALLGSPYRGKRGVNPVLPPHPQLAGAVSQVLDQRYKLQKDIATILSNNLDVLLRTYHVDCVVVAGRTPTDQEQQQAFEIYRNSLKDVRIVTFDELLLKLTSLRDFLASSPMPQGAPEDDDAEVDEDDGPQEPDTSSDPDLADDDEDELTP